MGHPGRVGPGTGVVAPQGIDVDHGEGSVPLVRDLDANGPTLVADQIVGVEELLPACTPAVPVVATEVEDPARRVVCVGIGRPRPHHVGMEDRHQRLGVLRVPRGRLKIDHRLDLTVNIAHQRFLRVFSQVEGGTQLSPERKTFRPEWKPLLF